VYRFMGEKEKSYHVLAPASDEEAYEVAYTETAPSGDWMNKSFDDSQWKKGSAPFTDNSSTAKTLWRSKDLWVRRSFDLQQTSFNKLFLKINHDDNVEVYINGEKVYSLTGWLNKFKYIPLPDAIKSKLVRGKNVLAIHVANTAGGAWLDAGLAEEQPAKP